MSSTLRYTIEELAGMSVNDLPSWCNVYARIRARPEHIASRGGWWRVEVEGLSGQTKCAIAVHEVPTETRLLLGYESTAADLLALFSVNELREAIAPGETVLVQAVPKWGEEGLWLNVPAIFIVRPFRKFGRTQIDYETHCARKMYLSVTKAVGAREHGTLHKGTVSGHIADDLLAQAFTDGLPAVDDDAMQTSLKPETLEKLIALGLQSSSQARGAIERSLHALRTLRESARVAELIKADSWSHDTAGFANGVSLAPDLLGRRHVVEMKFVSPASDVFKPHRFQRQARDYLAWAMVEYGVKQVQEGWKGVLLHLHPDVSEEMRIQEVTVEVELIARRILNRHRLLVFSKAGWLPAPNQSECESCEFSDTEVAEIDTTQALPAPCTFHCQTERNWDCWAYEGKSNCPLLDRCDQFKVFHDFEKLDHFTKLRQALIDEEEERAVISSLVHSLTAGHRGSTGGLIMPRLTVVPSKRRGELRLALPDNLRALELGSRGQVFDLMQEGRDVGSAVLRRRKDDVLVFSGVSAAALDVTHEVTLRFPMPSVSPLRHEMVMLERAQRAGQQPMSLRRAARRQDIARIERRTVADVGEDARLVLIDNPNKSDEETIVQLMLAKARGRVLLVLPDDAEMAPVGFVSVTGGAIGLDLAERRGRFVDRVLQLIDHVTKSAGIAVTRRILTAIDGGVFASLKLSDVIFLEAESLPSSVLARVLPLAHRVTLVGRAASAGPPMQSAAARLSMHARNMFALMLELGELIVPWDMESMEVVRCAPKKACVGAATLFGMRTPDAEAPLFVHEAESTHSVVDAGVQASMEVVRTASSGEQQRRQVTLRVEDERFSFRELEMASRGVTARSLERIALQDEMSIDTSVVGYRCLVERVELQNCAPGQTVQHTLCLRIPAERFGYLQSLCYSNDQEAKQLLEYARTRPFESFHAASPFVGQCVRIAQLASEMAVGNVRVYTLDAMKRNTKPGDKSLLVSMVVGAGSPGYPIEASQARMLDLFIGEYREYHVFCRPDAARHHPMLRQLYSHASKL